MNFRTKPRYKPKRILDISANGEPIAYIAYNSQRSDEEGHFIWRTTKAFRKYRKHKGIQKKYSHYMKSLRKCTAHAIEWLIFNTNSEAKSIEITEPKPQETKNKTLPIVEKKLAESKGILDKVSKAIEEESENLPVAS